ncbi:MAG: DUF3795 domain-containing protein [Bacteroidota bacterium]
MISNALIAPCGMNCGVCLACFRDKNRCIGCRPANEEKPKYCRKCIIINCELLSQTDSKFCYDCEKYPCRRLKQLDKRYRTKYRMSMIENLEFIRNAGLNKFVESENKRWICPNCGATICVHRDFCLNCKQLRNLATNNN